MRESSNQNDRIIAALETAIRAGFAVTFEPGKTGGVVVNVTTPVVRVGRATSRIKPFTIAKETLRDAAGNALSPIVLECGLDLIRAEATAAE